MRGGVTHLRDAEIDDLGRDAVAFIRDQDVRGLQIAVDDALLMSVMHRLADGDEKLQPVAEVELVLIAVAGDGAALDQLHDEVGHAFVGLPGIEDAGDVFMLHERQRLPFGGKATKDDGAIHAAFEDLDRHEALDGLHLLRTINDAESTLAQLVQKPKAVADPAVLAGDGFHGHLRPRFAPHRGRRAGGMHRGGGELTARIGHRDGGHIRRGLDGGRLGGRGHRAVLRRGVRHDGGHAAELIERGGRRGGLGGIRLHAANKRRLYLQTNPKAAKKIRQLFCGPVWTTEA